MSSHSGGGFFGHSRSSGHRRGGFIGQGHSSGHRGGLVGGLLGGSSSGRRGRYVQGGHYRPQRRGLGCLGVFVVGAALLGGGVAGLVSLVA
ncbi:hypothetical protein [Deinococcus petrolearius]|uniref:Uncharacterized protein n=1 Tax=Deinococcus petrolearius TaxID=1751295 RepID=A0ABW1DL85_9DEIO